jgi:actin
MASDGVIVVDAGSSSVKVGYSGEDIPRAIFPSAVDHPVLGENASRRPAPPEYGDSSDESTDHPIKRGHVTDWDKMERVWDYMFGVGLQDVYPETGSVNGLPVLLTEPPLNDSKSREKTAAYMFETFKAPSICICNSATLSLFASGRTRGVVLECGGGITSAVPIFEGFALPHATLRVDLGGQDVTKGIAHQLAEKGISSLPFSTVQDIKERCAFVSTSAGGGGGGGQGGQTDPTEGHIVELPDGTTITVDAACRSGAPTELLFPASASGKPNLRAAAEPANGAAALAHRAILMCDKDLQPDLFQSIVLSGGTTMLPGFSERMKHEIMRAAALGTSFSVVPDMHRSERGYNSQRRTAAWIGGSIFASLETFGQMQVTKQEWEDIGESIIHRKCF